jgi:hypothetical protein
MNTRPQAKSGDPVAAIIKQLRERARFYFARFERCGAHDDIVRATALQAALVGILEAKR